MLAEQKLKGELSLLYSREDIFRGKNLSNLLGSLSSDELMLEIFSELIKLLKIVITTPMTTAEPERCFSTLKRIKTFLRSTMTTDRLSALAMISIGKDLISETENFNDLVIDYFASSKNRQMDLVFK